MKCDVVAIVLRLDIVTENMAAELTQVCEQFLEATAERVEEPRLVAVDPPRWRTSTSPCRTDW
jgi:hypothetical protein